MLLLDTHVWVWSVEGDAHRIGRVSRRLLQRAASRGDLRVSPVSVFEIAALCTAGRLRLAQSAESWIAQALGAPAVRIGELTTGIAVDAGQIPRAALPDPCDRLLVATASRLEATLLTADETILAYASRSGRVRVSDARN